MDERSSLVGSGRMRRSARLALVALPLVGGLALAVPMSAAAQLATVDQPNLSASGSGRASGAAETARIQFLVGIQDPFGGSFGGPPPAMDQGLGEEGTPSAAGGADDAEPVGDFESGGPAGPPAITEDDLEPMLAVIEEAGVEREAIAINTGPSVAGLFGPGGPGTALVEFSVEQPESDAVNGLVSDALEAGNEAGLFVQHAGVDYDVADCSALIREARELATADARDSAEQLAEVAEVTLGDLIQVSDYGFFGTPAEPDDEGCPPAPQTVFYGSESLVDTPPFDPSKEAEASAYSTINLTFAITEDGA